METLTDMRISEVAAACGLSIDTIRYYERSGMCPRIARDSAGKRKFTRENADWFTLLSSLRETGMPTKDMRHFANLYRQGNKTVAERKRLLLDHSSRLEERQRALKKCEKLLACKLALYNEILEDGT